MNITDLKYSWKNVNAPHFGSSKEVQLSKIVILAIFSFIILLLNVSVVVLYYLNYSLKKLKIADILLLNQAIIDISHGVVLLPMKLLTLASVQFAIVSYNYIVCFTHYLAAFSNMVIAVDRFISVAKPILHNSIVRKTHAFRAVASVWIVTLILTFIPLCWWHKEPNTHPGIIMRNYALFLTILLLITLSCMTILTCITFSLTLHWQRSRYSWSDNCHIAVRRAQEIHLALLFCAMIFVYFLTFAPIVVMTFFDVLGVSYPEEVMMDVSFLVYSSSSIFNGIATLRFKFKNNIRKLISPALDQNEEILLNML